jgi:hypothetical protein
MASKGGVVVVISGEDNTGELFKAIDAHMAETRAVAEETSLSLGKVGESLKHGLETAGLFIGAAEAVHIFEEMISSSVEAGVQLGHLSQQTGISVENLSVLKYAAQSTGVDFEVLTRGFKKLAVTTNEADHGNKAAAKGFEMVGISVQQLRAKGDDMYGVLTLLADKFHALPDGMAKSDAAAKIFGTRMGAEMIPVLNALAGKLDETKAEAAALGLVWDEDGIKKMEELHHKLVTLKGGLQGLGIEITTNLTPILLALGEAVKDDVSWLSQLLGITETVNGKASIIQRNAVLATMPKGLETDQSIGNGAEQDKSAAEKKMSAIEDQYAKQLISDKAYMEKKAAIARDFDQADLRINQAYWLQLERQIAAAQTQLNRTIANDRANPDGSGGVHEGQIRAQQKILADLNATQQQVASKIVGYAGKEYAPHPLRDDDGEAEGKRNNTLPQEEHLAQAHRQLADALAKSDEVRARAQASTLLDIFDEMHKRGLMEETAYLAQKASLQDAAFDAERTMLANQQIAVIDQQDALTAKSPKTDKERLEIEAKDVELQREALALNSKMTDLDARRAKATREIADALADAQKTLNTPINMAGPGMNADKDILGAIMPEAPKVQLDPTAAIVENEAEKFAHGVFDPLFNLGEKWDKQWKQIRANMLKDTGQLAESMLFGQLFGDPSGKGGKGWDGSAGGGQKDKGIRNHDGLVGGALDRLFGGKSSPVSNGIGAAGAGTVSPAAAAKAALGKAAGSGGVTVNITNTGTPQTATAIQTPGPDLKDCVIQIVSQDQATNGPMTQGWKALMPGL